MVEEFESFNCNVDVYDPCVDKEESILEYNIQPIDNPINGKYDAILLAVADNEFKKLASEQKEGFLGCSI